jgi:hypothetical protein
LSDSFEERVLDVGLGGELSSGTFFREKRQEFLGDLLSIGFLPYFFDA